DWPAGLDTFRHLAGGDLGVDRVFLVDPHATLMAEFPATEAAVGRNFADRDWYKGVTRTGNTYVSDAYKRFAAPQVNVIAATAPVTNGAGSVIAYAVLQVRAETLLSWGTSFGSGTESFVFFADRSGQAIAHPAFPPDAPLENVYAYRPVERALASDRGVSIVTDPYL